jgi:hypothetical protein
MMSSAPNLPANTLRGQTARGQRRAEAFDIKGKSVEPEQAVDGLQFGRFDESRMGNGHRMQRAVQFLPPKVEKPLQFREYRAEIVLLPHVRLKQPGVIGPPIENVCGGEPVSGKLTPEVTTGHFGPPGISKTQIFRHTTVPLQAQRVNKLFIIKVLAAINQLC